MSDDPKIQFELRLSQIALLERALEVASASRADRWWNLGISAILVKIHEGVAYGVERESERRDG